MKKDTQIRPGVSHGSLGGSKMNTPSVPISEPSEAAQQERRADAAAPSVVPSISMSARYIDSRLKQFCWR